MCLLVQSGLQSPPCLLWSVSPAQMIVYPVLESSSQLFKDASTLTLGLDSLPRELWLAPWQVSPACLAGSISV